LIGQDFQLNIEVCN